MGRCPKPRRSQPRGVKPRRSGYAAIQIQTGARAAPDAAAHRPPLRTVRAPPIAPATTRRGDLHGACLDVPRQALREKPGNRRGGCRAREAKPAGDPPTLEPRIPKGVPKVWGSAGSVRRYGHMIHRRPTDTAVAIGCLYRDRREGYRHGGRQAVRKRQQCPPRTVDRAGRPRSRHALPDCPTLFGTLLERGAQ